MGRNIRVSVQGQAGGLRRCWVPSWGAKSQVQACHCVGLIPKPKPSSLNPSCRLYPKPQITQMTDGITDVFSNQEAAEVVCEFLASEAGMQLLESRFKLCWGMMEKKMETLGPFKGLYRGYIRIMEKKMET